MNKKNFPILVAISVVAIAAGLLAYFGSTREPRYQDRSLTEWLQSAVDAFKRPGIDPYHPEQDSQWHASQVALTRMGTNAIPFLLQDLLAPESKWKSEISDIARGTLCTRMLPQDLRIKLIRLKWDSIYRRGAAIQGFAMLGTNAGSADSILIGLIGGQNVENRRWAFAAFSYTRPSREIFIPVATNLLKGQDEYLRESTADTFINLYPEDAKKAGVYDLFPNLDPSSTNQPIWVD